MKKKRMLYLVCLTLAAAVTFTITPARIHASAAQEAIMETLFGTESEMPESESEAPASESELAEPGSEVPASESEMAESESEVPASESKVAESESEVPASESEMPGSETESGEVTVDPAASVNTEILSGLVQKAEALEAADYSAASYTDTGFPALTGAAKDLLIRFEEAAYTEEAQSSVDLAAKTLDAAIRQLEAAPESTESADDPSETEAVGTETGETAGSETAAVETADSEMAAESQVSESTGAGNTDAGISAQDTDTPQTAAAQTQTPDTSDSSDVYKKVLLMIISLMLALRLRRVIYWK